MKTRLTLLLITLLVLFAGTELALRKWLHIVPGVHTYSQWFTEVNTLITHKGYYADSNGIFKTHPDVAVYLHNRLDSFTYNNYPPIPYPYVCLEFYGLERDYFEIQNPAYHNSFAHFVRGLQQKDTAQLDEVDKAILHYLKNPVNSDGFRGIEFKNYHTAKKKVLLLGDSFTWGHSTPNKTASFADLLLAKGYAVYNTGISGADPAQYLTIARRYIAQLKPDYVVVNFFMGNDIFYTQRPVLPYHPIFYCTNAGNLLACPDGIYFENPNHAYQYAKNHFRIPQSGLINKMCSATAIGTLAFKVADKLQYLLANGLQKYNTSYRYKDRVNYKNYWLKADLLEQPTPVCNRELKQIEELCAANKARFFLIAIPEIRGSRLIYPDHVPLLFDSLTYTIPAGITAQDYEADNGHYNVEGHRKHAEHIVGLIRQ